MKNLNEVTQEDIDPRIAETAKRTVVEGGPPIASAVVGVSSGLFVSRGINRFVETKPEAERRKWRYGLKGLATGIGLIEIAGSTTMRNGTGKTVAMVGGATFVATQVVEMGSDALSERGIVVFAKSNKLKHWSPQAANGGCGEGEGHQPAPTPTPQMKLRGK